MPGIGDLNDLLFQQLNRLNDASLTAEQIEAESTRTEAMVSVADQISRAAALQLQAAKLFAEHGQAVLPHLPMIGRSKEGGS